MPLLRPYLTTSRRSRVPVFSCSRHSRRLESSPRNIALERFREETHRQRDGVSFARVGLLRARGDAIADVARAQHTRRGHVGVRPVCAPPHRGGRPARASRARHIARRFLRGLRGSGRRARVPSRRGGAPARRRRARGTLHDSFARGHRRGGTPPPHATHQDSAVSRAASLASPLSSCERRLHSRFASGRSSRRTRWTRRFRKRPLLNTKERLESNRGARSVHTSR